MHSAKIKHAPITCTNPGCNEKTNGISTICQDCYFDKIEENRKEYMKKWWD